MKEFKEYLEQVALRGQSISIGANLIMDATKGEIEVK
jgi:hypothetical protein